MSDPITILVGGPLRDAAEPSHGVEPHRCAVCATERDLTLLPLDGAPQCICSTCFRAVMHRIGTPSHSGAVSTCTSTSDCPNPFGVVAVWPPQTVFRQDDHFIRACPHHLATALAAEVAERAATATETSR